MPTTQTPSNPVDEWNAQVQAKVDQGLSIHRATASVIRVNPDLHKRMLQAVNAGRPSAGVHRV